MVISPVVRGLLGLDWDALNHALIVNPQLPGEWDHVRVHNVPLGSLRLELDITRRTGELIIQGTSGKPEQFCLSSERVLHPCTASPGRIHELRLPLRPVEISVPAELPLPGSRTHQLKVTDETYTDNSATFSFSALAKARYELPVRLNRAGIRVEGATLSGGRVVLQIPDGTRYQTQTVTFRW
jgi:hypothetical protein